MRAAKKGNGIFYLSSVVLFMFDVDVVGMAARVARLALLSTSSIGKLNEVESKQPTYLHCTLSLNNVKSFFWERHTTY